MAENDRNRGGYRSSNQDWNDSSRQNRDSEYDDRGTGGSYGSRYEGNYGNQSGRYNQDYGEGSTYGSGRYNRETDYNRGGSGTNYSGSEYNRYSQDYNPNSGSSNYENRRRDSGSSSYGGFGDTSGGFGSSRYGRTSESYNPGGYQNYGGGSGYGGSYFGGGYGGSSFGRNYGSSGLGSEYGEGMRGGQSNYGGSTERGWDSDQNRGYGSTYGRRSGMGSGYGSDYGSSYRGNDRGNERNQDRGFWDKASDEVSSWFGDDDAERRRRMDRMHKGRGPRNYQRSDERIKEDVNDRLSDDWFIDASEIDVSVENGEVTLTGTVDERTAKRRAEDIADSISGVKNVENRIRVSQGYQSGNYGSRESSLRSSDTTTGSSSTAGTIAGTSTGAGTSGKSKSSLMSDTNK